MLSVTNERLESIFGLRRLREEFGEGLPVIPVPAHQQVLGVALRKSRMVEDQVGAAALRAQLEVRDGIHSCVPVADPPRLHDSLVGQEFELPASDISAE